ncbi:MAG: hypothetical protein WCP68_15890 [Enhydrobacter sp.]
MLPVTKEETDFVKGYVEAVWKEKVTFAQKMHVESILGHLHAVWDVHYDKGRLWVITNPTKGYGQDMWPSMDLRRHQA